jgi:hypothetical protein
MPRRTGFIEERESSSCRRDIASGASKHLLSVQDAPSWRAMKL